MIGWYLKRVDPVLARVWRVSTEKSVHDLNNWEIEKDAWVREFHEEVCALEFTRGLHNGLTEVSGRFGTSAVSMQSLVQD